MAGGGTSTNRSATETRTQNLSFQGIEGFAIAGNEGNITLTDQGALEQAGFAFAETIGLVKDVINSSQEQNDTAAALAAAVVNSESTNEAPRIENIANKVLIGGALLATALIFKDKF